jgi:hypothetical protein
MRGRDDYGIGRKIGQALGLAIRRPRGVSQGEFGLGDAVWVRIGSFPEKSLNPYLSESIRYQHFALDGLSSVRTGGRDCLVEELGTGPKWAGNGLISSFYPQALELG